ncbi:hypothetical protein P7F88_25225 [Vibrio hannami]|uniref:hypothetical protein n=1 Tax=Vibrio hannami TaxID=2717094 RepID=UPI002410185E|nr:hypothetical protein [Vibrio hannami]MDG3089167.1 hypothetical protein [Vibrio hannami]
MSSKFQKVYDAARLVLLEPDNEEARQALDELVNTKKCTMCQTIKRLDADFDLLSTSADGYRSQCKECRKKERAKKPARKRRS